MAGSGTAAWLPRRPDEQPPSASGPRFARAPGERKTTGRATRPFRFGSEDRPDPDPALAPGALVGERYRIVRLLGEGGMGRVYEAEHTVLQRRVALKLLRRLAQEQPENLARFRQEALAASRIGTPQIVEVVDFASHAGPAGVQTYMVMELLDGEGLEAWMDDNGPLDVGVELLAQLCDGLAAAHRAGVIHRDIKPANVFCQPPDPTRVDGQAGMRVKILDFGIAKMTAGGQGVHTQQGSLLGTPYYLAPERVMGDTLTAAADMYSVGVILYEMLTGNVPFTADSFMGILARHVHAEPLDPRQAAPERNIPDAVASLCMAMLAKRPEQRPTAEAAALTLRSMLARDRSALAAVRVGTCDVAAGPGLDTQLITESPGESLAERPTLPPMDSFAGASVDQRPRSSTTIGHAPVAAVVPATPSVTMPIAVQEPEQRSRVGVIVAAIVLVVGGVIAVAIYSVRSQLRAESLAEKPEQPVAAEPPATNPVPVAQPPEPEPVPTPAPVVALPATDPVPTPEPPPSVSSDKPNTSKKPKPEAKPEPAPTEPEAKPEPAPTEPEPAPTEPEPKTTPPVDPNLPTIKDDVYE